MSRPLICPAALSGEEIVWAPQAQRGIQYSCPSCFAPVVPRQGAIRRHHFAHLSGAINCSTESQLHALCKRLISGGFEAALKERRSYELDWRCSECHVQHRGNLTKQGRRILIEPSFHGVRPDPLVEDEAGRAVAAVEVVVTHSPDPKTLAVYARQHLPVLVTGIANDDIALLSQRLGTVEAINSGCRAPRCSRCKNRMHFVELQQWEGYHCYNCNEAMSIFQAIDVTAGLMTPRLPRTAIRVAQDRGGKIEVRYSKTAGARYPMHVCGRCNYGQGDHYSRPVMWADSDAYEVASSFWVCGDCDRWQVADA